MGWETIMRIKTGFPIINLPMHFRDFWMMNSCSRLGTSTLDTNSCSCCWLFRCRSSCFKCMKHLIEVAAVSVPVSRYWSRWTPRKTSHHLSPSMQRWHTRLHLTLSLPLCAVSHRWYVGMNKQRRSRESNCRTRRLPLPHLLIGRSWQRRWDRNSTAFLPWPINPHEVHSKHAIAMVSFGWTRISRSRSSKQFASPWRACWRQTALLYRVMELDASQRKQC